MFGKMQIKHAAVVGFSIAALVGLGAAGMFPGIPLTTSALTGSEIAPFDTQLTQGLNPATEMISTSQLAGFERSQAGSGGWRNKLIGGDFGTNPWQRGTSFTGMASTSAIYTADRFWVASGAATQNVSLSKQTGASDITQAYAASARLQRLAASSDTSQICFGQVLTSADSTQFQGSTAAVEFHALAGANFSAANSGLTVAISYGTGSDQSATTFAGGTWTGQATPAIAAMTGTTLLNTAQVATSTTWARYAVSAAIPATATQIGVKWCYTPVGTAGTNDWVELAGLQLEVNPTSVPGSFERRPAVEELRLALPYTQVVSEVSGVRINTGLNTTTTNARIWWPSLGGPMRATPTVTATVGTFAVAKSDGTSQTCTALAGVATAASTGTTLDCTVAANLIAGNATILIGAGTTGGVKLDSEL